jgi:hypothetical protein
VDIKKDCLFMVHTATKANKQLPPALPLSFVLCHHPRPTRHTIPPPSGNDSRTQTTVGFSAQTVDGRGRGCFFVRQFSNPTLRWLVMNQKRTIPQ